MRTAPKIALSLLLSILLFSGLAVAAYAGLFNILETRFYQSAVIASMEKQNEATADALKTWHAENTERFGNFVNAEPVKRSLLPNQSTQDIFDRLNLAGSLMAEMPGLIGIRLIDAGDTTIAPQDDKGTRRIHFSTFKDDVLTKIELQISYKNYGTSEEEVPFKFISVLDGKTPKVIFDTGSDQFLYCFPFYDSYTSWRGTAVFYISTRSALQFLVSRNLSRISDDLIILSNPEHTVSGIVTGMPRVGTVLLGNAILDRWATGNFTTDRLVTTDNDGWVLLSREMGSTGFFGQLVQESLFVFPQSVKILFLTIAFFTLFLVIFLLFNLKQDEMVIIRNRIRRFHVQLLNELVDTNEELHWDDIRKNLSTRKSDISAEIKKSFGRKLTKKHGKEIDSLLAKSWDEIFSALGQQEHKQENISNTDEIRLMLEQVLQNNAIRLNLTGIPSPAKVTAAKSVVAEEIEELAEEPEELAEEIEELTEEPEELAEEPEELAEEPEELAEEIEELAEEIEELAEEPEELAEEIEELAEEPEELAEEPEELAEEPEELAEEPEELAEEPEELAEAIAAVPEVEVLAETVADSMDMHFSVETVEDIEEIEPLESEKSVVFEEILEMGESSDLTEKASAFDGFSVFNPLPANEPEVTETVFVEIVEEAETLEAPSDQIEELEELNEDTEEIEEIEELDGNLEEEEEAESVVEENGPDTVLVYNFEEKPGLDSTHRELTEYTESDFNDTFHIAGLDFTALDLMDMDDILNVDYINPSAFSMSRPLKNYQWESPVFEFLEAIGEEEPDELIDIDGNEDSDVSSITSSDGLFLVSPVATPSSGKPLDSDFQDLVNSVLL